ncbi:hypothetical protein M441DRAFT_48234 [Trichoderma asperellum CBS 433.97]|uniref:Uncharacterized protein n=1 Tax=Trichoderma asperellum (strain ATCC 204424 / CBS 433.97 / NBRC 101777) TaxID=1042311 RepID=A0A2T3Z6D6_TRIA4|nr:hypothetical protein M441DRAFT_48234 [Trichoderma asperellum CBS 433.97]PTB40391.1 hypothetical protein M441DRAFT_48234 [Trichoderma asperellum CBS 433.97]
MASPNPQTIHWLFVFFHKLNVSEEKSRRLLEDRKSECDQLRQQLQDKVVQKDESEANRKMNDQIIRGKQEVIDALDHTLKSYRDTSAAARCDVDLVTVPPRPHTPWPAELVISQTSSETTLNDSLDSQYFASGVIRQPQKRGSEAEAESPFKKQRLD